MVQNEMRPLSPQTSMGRKQAEKTTQLQTGYILWEKEGWLRIMSREQSGVLTKKLERRTFICSAGSRVARDQ